MSQQRQERPEPSQRDARPASNVDRDLSDSPANQRFMGEGLNDTPKPEPKPASGEPGKKGPGGGFDSQRTYDDASYGKGEEAHRDPHAGAERDPFGGRGERKEDTSEERTDDKPDYPAEEARDRWTDGRPPSAVSPQDASDADEIPLDTSHGGIDQHETAWSQNVGPMGAPQPGRPVHEQRYGAYGDGTSDASGYAGFRESHLGDAPGPTSPQPRPLPPITPPPRR